MNLNIRPYIQDNDLIRVRNLWDEILGKKWPINSTLLKRKLSEGEHIVALRDGEIVGFLATQRSKNKIKQRGEIMLVLVAEDCQRQGVGRKLLDQSLKNLKSKNVFDIQLGGGGGSYFWPGVPRNLPGAIDFFKSCGWNFSEISFDLLRDLKNYKTPDWISERVRPLNIKNRFIKSNEKQKILTFEKKSFPKWYSAFQSTINSGDLGDVLVAVDSDEEILGSTVLFSPKSKSYQQKFIWSLILGKNSGGFGALGVKEEARNRGIGLILSATASEILKKRGIRNCLLGWTHLVSWYGKLGYKVWMKYDMSWKKL